MDLSSRFPTDPSRLARRRAGCVRYQEIRVPNRAHIHRELALVSSEQADWPNIQKFHLMSPIARVFSVLNLILAVFFLAWASNSLATSQAFKQKFDGEAVMHQETEDTLQGQISTLET